MFVHFEEPEEPKPGFFANGLIDTDWIIIGCLTLIGTLTIAVIFLSVKLRQANRLFLKMLKLIPRDSSSLKLSQGQNQIPVVVVTGCNQNDESVVRNSY